MTSPEDRTAVRSLDDAIQSFAKLAERYCNLIDGHSDLAAESLLHQVHGLLPLLYSAALELPDPDANDGNAGETFDDVEDAGDEALLSDKMLQPDPDRISHDEWQNLFVSLGKLLGPLDGYWSVFDPYATPDEPPGFASLADDISDIYRDLKDGLTKYRRGEFHSAAWEWRFGFNSHWAAHASSGLRAIEALSSMHDLGFPPRTEQT